jgi:hypothetical protein
MCTLDVMLTCLGPDFTNLQIVVPVEPENLTSDGPPQLAKLVFSPIVPKFPNCTKKKNSSACAELQFATLFYIICPALGPQKIASLTRWRGGGMFLPAACVGATSIQVASNNMHQWHRCRPLGTPIELIY